MQAWLVLGPWQKLCFVFLFTVTAVTLVRALRLCWWRMQLRASSGTGPQADSSAALRVWRASNLARSTRGLAQAALWFTCAGAAFGMYSAGMVLGNSSRSTLAVVAEASLYVVDATGLGVGWCSLLFIAAWVFEAGTPRAIGRHRILGMIGRARQLLWPMAMVFIAAALFEFRPTFMGVATEADRLTGYAILVALWQLWSRLSVLCAAIGTVAWLSVLLESALARRLRPA